MFPLSADLEILIPIPARAESNTAGVVAWLEKHFQMMDATVVRRGPDSLEVELSRDQLQYRPPRALSAVRRLDIEIRAAPHGLAATFEVHYRPLHATLSLGAGALAAAFFPFAGSIAPALVGLSFALGPPLLIQGRVNQTLRELCRDIADSYLEQRLPRLV